MVLFWERFLPNVRQVNRHLLKDLISRDLWNDEMRVKLIANNGSC